MSTRVTFQCGAYVDIDSPLQALDITEDHYRYCHSCPDDRTQELEQRKTA